MSVKHSPREPGLQEGDSPKALRERWLAAQWERDNLPSQEEMEHLSRLFREKGWELLVGYLAKWEANLLSDLCSPHTGWEKTLFVRGQRDSLMRILRMPEEMKQLKEKMRDGSE